ncbi:MAG: NADH-quinone oxidoreductase subunit N, partial [Planctomycetota bacterium]
VVMSVVSLFYYFRIVKTLFLREADPGLTKVRSPLLGCMLATLAAASIFFLWFDPLLALARSGVETLF